MSDNGLGAPKAPLTQIAEKKPGRGPWIAVGVAAVVLLGVGLWVVLGAGEKAPEKRVEKAPVEETPKSITGSRYDGGAPRGNGAGADLGAKPARGSVAGTPKVEAKPDERTASGMVRKAGTLVAGRAVSTTLRGHGVSSRDALALLGALKGLFDFRKARPGHRYELHLEPQTNKPVYFRYRVRMDRIFEVRKTPGGFVGVKVKVVVSKRILRYGGTVLSSFAGALAARGAHPSLVARIAAVLTSQPRFFKEQRLGDRFRVVLAEEHVDGKHLRFGPVLALEYVSLRSGTIRLFRFDYGGEGSPYHTERGVSMQTTRLHIPVHYTRISSPFGSRFHPVLKRQIMHNGVDLVANSGTHVRACLPGKVIIAGRRGAYGNLVVLDHGGGLHSYYAHLLRFERHLRKGKKVRKRRVIGYVGNTGRSTGAHLHWGLKLAGRFIDPLSYRIRPGRPVPVGHRARWRRVLAKQRKLLDTTPLRPLPLPGVVVPLLPLGGL